MSKHKLSYHVSKFSESIRLMNDAHSKTLTMTAVDARNLHTDIFALLAKIAELSDVKKAEEPTIAMDAGSF